MFRRRFLQIMTMAGAAGLAPLEAMSAASTSTVAFRVKGFSCITCATGLDTMLRRQTGITASNSTYPEGRTVVRFDPTRITGQAIAACIADLGFTVEAEPKS